VVTFISIGAIPCTSYMCGICGVYLLGDHLSDEIKERVANAISTLTRSEEDGACLDGKVLVENNAAAAGIAYYLNVKLNHRGRESSGILTFDGSQPYFHGGMGIAKKVFTLDDLLKLKGDVAAGHDRYATAGEAKPQNIQPHCLSFIHQKSGDELFTSIAHNGNITNEADLRKKVLGEERRLGEKLKLSLESTTDTELVLHSIALELYQHPRRHLQNTIKHSMRGIRGAYSVVGTINDKLIGFRDSYGTWHLYFARMRNDIALFASEKYPLQKLADALGYDAKDVRIREVEKGELIIVNKNGIQEYKDTFPKRKGRICSFKPAYLESQYEEYAEKLRIRIGEVHGAKLRNASKDGWYVVPVPNSGILYAQGLSEKSGIPFEKWIEISDKYSRSFIHPTQRKRVKATREKYTFKNSYTGKAFFLTDDSIVRSTTMTYLIRELRDRGIEELHVRVGTPQIVNPCWLGVQIPTTKELIAADLSRSQIEKYFECIFYGVDYKMEETSYRMWKLYSLVKQGASVKGIIEESIKDNANRYMDNLEMTEYKKGKFSLKYLTLKEFRQAFDDIGLNSKERCTACMQKNLSGYTPAMRNDLIKAGAV